MSSTIYNHKHLQPAGTLPPPIGSTVLNNCFNSIREEFQNIQEQCDILRAQRDEFENKITNQVNELNIIRQSLYDLETQHGKIRQQYEEDLRILRAELDSYKRRGAPEPLGLASLGRDREREREREFAQREREARDRDRDRDRDVVMGNTGPPRPDALGRDALGLGRPPVPSGPPPGPGGEPLGPLGLTPHAGPVGLGVGAGPGGGGGYGDPYYSGRDRDRDRERDRERDRDRDRDRGDRSMLDRERERDREGREVKRIKTERDRMKPERPDPFSPSMGPQPPPSHLTSHHHHQSISLGPAAPLPPPSANGAPPTPSGGPPSAAQATPKLPPTPSAGPPYTTGPGGTGRAPGGQGSGQEGANGAAGPQPYPPTPTATSSTTQEGSSSMAGTTLPPPPSSSSQMPPMPVDLSMDPHTVPPELKNEGPDWFAIFNPAPPGPGDGPGAPKKRALDVKLVHTLMHESVVCCVRFSADGKYLATGCNRTAQIYDTKTGQKTCVLVDEAASKTGDLYIRSVCFSPDGQYLATGAEDKQIRIWDIQQKRIRTVFEGHQQEIYSLDFSRDGRLIVSGSGDRTARIWDMNDIDSACKVLNIREPDNVDAGVTSVCISPDGRFVAAGSLDTVVRIWDVQTGQLVERLEGHRDSVYSVAFTPDGRGLVSGSLDKTLKYWDVRPLLRSRESGAGASGKTGPGQSGKDGVVEKASQCTMNFTGHKDYVLSVAVSHDGKWVVSGSKDRGVQFWDANTAVAQCMLQGHKNSVISIDLSPAGNVLATGSGDWQARIWEYSPVR